MRKKIISILLISVIALGFIPLVMRAEGSTGPVPKGEYNYMLDADTDTGTPPTCDLVSGGFGAPESNGRIWSDKSVSVNGDHFDVNLKVLAQEYISSYGTTVTQSIAADVVFVLDMTGSMITGKLTKPSGGSVTRFAALVDAANEAIEIITNTNPNNRITIYGYYGGRSNAANVCKQILPLGHYESTSTATGTEGKYLVYRKTGTGNTAYIDTSTTLLKDGVSYTNSVKNGTGTNTQYGIARGVKGLVDDITNEYETSGKNGDRKPYVIVLTDGASNVGSFNWYSETYNPDPTNWQNELSDYSNNTISSSSSNDNNAIISALTILTASFWRKQLNDAYTAYNGKNLGVEWFNIGLDLGDDKEKETGVALNPESLRDAVADRTTGIAADKVKYHLKNAGTVNQIPTYYDYDFLEDYEYIYTYGEDGGYVTFADTYNRLMGAFQTLADIIKLGSQEYTVPIVNHEGSGEQSSDMVFTDVLGEGMYVKDLTLKQNAKAPVQGVKVPKEEGHESENFDIYTFPGFETTVKVTEDETTGQQTLEWNLPASEVAMFTFEDRTDVEHSGYVAADPTALTIGVDFTDDIEFGPGYTNAFDESEPGNKVPLTTITYEIPGDNTYYYDVIQDSDHNFVSSTIKATYQSVQTTGKGAGDNVTDTAGIVSSYTYNAQADGTENSSAVVTGLLGNNGIAEYHSRREYMDLVLTKKWKDANGHDITNTAGLPSVRLYLMRQAGSEPEEEYKEITLSNSNGYTQSETVKIRDDNNVKYTYYLLEKAEDIPDGYYISDYSVPIVANDGTLSITNQVLNEEGSLIVKKIWQNKLGENITDTANMPDVQVQLRRHVTTHTPKGYSVKINVQGVEKESFNVVKDSQISFYVWFYGSNRNNSNGTITQVLNGTSSTITNKTNQVQSRERNGAWTGYTCRTGLLTYTITQDTEISFTYSKNLSTSRTPNTRVLKFVKNNMGNNDFTDLDTVAQDGVNYTDVGTPSYTENEVGNERVENFSLSKLNNWQKVYPTLLQSKRDSKTGITYFYTYYIVETPVSGYETTYSDNNTLGVTEGTLTVTNRSTIKLGPLPNTGGRGSPHRAEIIGLAAVFFSIMLLFMRFASPLIKKLRRPKRQNI